MGVSDTHMFVSDSHLGVSSTILGVSNTPQIKMAYRARALEWHPDNPAPNSAHVSQSRPDSGLDWLTCAESNP